METTVEEGVKRKLLNYDQCAVKVNSPNTSGPVQFSGYASVFNNVDVDGDTIEQGAFMDTLDMRDWPVLMRWNHFGPVIGKWLSIAEDDRGLFVKGELTPGHTTARNVAASMRHGAVGGLSIGFRIRDAEQQGDVQVIRSIDLIEISVVENPANRAATINEVKSIIDKADSLKECERILRDVGGFSNSSAAAFISKIKTVCLGDQGASNPAKTLGDQGRQSETLNEDAVKELSSWVQSKLVSGGEK